MSRSSSSCITRPSRWASIDGASVLARIRHIYVPLAVPAFVAFAIVSVTAHWNEFLWPLHGSDNGKFMASFWPVLYGNAIIDRKIYAVPFQNSTPLLYVNADHFKEAGLDPEKVPQTWDELLAAAKKLTRREGDKVVRWGIMIPSNYNYLGWIVSALTMSNWRPLLQRGVRRRGLLRYAVHARARSPSGTISSPSTR